MAIFLFVIDYYSSMILKFYVNLSMTCVFLKRTRFLYDLCQKECEIHSSDPSLLIRARGSNF